MKIKKDNLKKIIKEEVDNYLEEIIETGSFELEDEVAEPSDEDHLFNLLTKEFERIPQEKRRSIYTRFLFFFEKLNNFSNRFKIFDFEDFRKIKWSFWRLGNLNFQDFRKIK